MDMEHKWTSPTVDEIIGKIFHQWMELSQRHLKSKRYCVVLLWRLLCFQMP